MACRERILELSHSFTTHFISLWRKRSGRRARLVLGPVPSPLLVGGAGLVKRSPPLSWHSERQALGNSGWERTPDRSNSVGAGRRPPPSPLRPGCGPFLLAAASYASLRLVPAPFLAVVQSIPTAAGRVSRRAGATPAAAQAGLRRTGTSTPHSQVAAHVRRPPRQQCAHPRCAGWGFSHSRALACSVSPKRSRESTATWMLEGPPAEDRQHEGRDGAQRTALCERRRSG